MPYYDPETISDFAGANGHQIWPFRANTEDPAGDPAHLNETADFLRDLFARAPGQAARRLVHVPMGRFARAEEIAAAALFLASDESSFVTASTFLVDGGISAAYVTPE